MSRKHVQVLVYIKKHVMKIMQMVCRACWQWLTKEGKLKPTDIALDETVGTVALPSCSVAVGC